MTNPVADPSGHVLITRNAKDSFELQSLLKGSGITLRPFPVLRLAEHSDRRGWKAVVKLLAGTPEPRPWLVLTSPRAARFLCEQARDRGIHGMLDLPAAAIGEATGRAGKNHGLRIKVVGSGTGIDLARQLDDHWPGPTAAILAAAVHARPELPSTLKAGGHTVVNLAVYEMKATPPMELPPIGPADAIVLTSPRATELYLEAVGGLPLPLVHWALGPTTQNAANALGIKDCRIPASPSMEDLAEALRKHHDNTSV